MDSTTEMLKGCSDFIAIYLLFAKLKIPLGGCSDLVSHMASWRNLEKKPTKHPKFTHRLSPFTFHYNKELNSLGQKSEGTCQCDLNLPIAFFLLSLAGNHPGSGCS